MEESNKNRELSSTHRESISKGLNEYYKTNPGPNKGKTLDEAHKNKISQTLRKNQDQRIKRTREDIERLVTQRGVILLDIYSKESNFIHQHTCLAFVSVATC